MVDSRQSGKLLLVLAGHIENCILDKVAEACGYLFEPRFEKLDFERLETAKLELARKLRKAYQFSSWPIFAMGACCKDDETSLGGRQRLRTSPPFTDERFLA
jgi:hypothetical protein